MGYRAVQPVRHPAALRGHRNQTWGVEAGARSDGMAREIIGECSGHGGNA
jgi:hypothetical protein